MSRRFYQKQAEEMLERIQGAHAYIVANPGCTTKDIAKHLQLNFSQAQYAYHALLDSGHIRMQIASAGGMRSRCATYYVINAAVPVAVVSKRSTVKTRAIQNSGDMVEKRPRVEAKQIGMWRDPLVVALFGPAPEVQRKEALL